MYNFLSSVALKTLKSKHYFSMTFVLQLQIRIRSFITYLEISRYIITFIHFRNMLFNLRCEIYTVNHNAVTKVVVNLVLHKLLPNSRHTLYAFLSIRSPRNKHILLKVTTQTVIGFYPVQKLLQRM